MLCWEIKGRGDWNVICLLTKYRTPPVIGFADCPANTSLWKYQAPRRKAGAALPPTQKRPWESRVAQTVLMETACCRATCEVRDLVLHVHFAHSEGNAVPIPREARNSVQAPELHLITEVKKPFLAQLVNADNHPITSSPRGCLRKKVCLHKEQVTALDMLFHATFKLTTFAKTQSLTVIITRGAKMACTKDH